MGESLVGTSSASLQGPDVLYVMGSGRSGSTLLDMLLGLHPEVFSGGELMRYVLYGRTRGEYCACGSRVPACSFWQSVQEAWQARCSDWSEREYLRLSCELEVVKSLPRNMGMLGANDSDRETFVRWTRALYAAIAEVSGRRVIVDSSKSAARAALVSQALDGRAHIWHLVRDGRGVVHSYAKSFQKSEREGLQHDMPGRSRLRSALMWSTKNVFLSGLQRAGLCSRLLRYEALVEHPLAALNTVGGPVNLKYDEFADVLSSEIEITGRHTVAGNRLRTQERIRLRMDTAWRGRFGVSEKLLYWPVAWPGALIFGYVD